MSNYKVNDIDVLGQIFLSKAFNQVVNASQAIAVVGATSLLATGCALKLGEVTPEMFRYVLEPAILSILPTFLLSHLRIAVNKQYAPLQEASLQAAPQANTRDIM